MTLARNVPYYIGEVVIRILHAMLYTKMFINPEVYKTAGIHQLTLVRTEKSNMADQDGRHSLKRGWRGGEG